MITITSTVTTTSHHHDQGLQFHEFDSKLLDLVIYENVSTDTKRI